MDQIIVDNSKCKCLKSCSGLIVTSYTFYDLNKNLEDLLPTIGRYNHYKKITKHPSGYNALWEKKGGYGDKLRNDP